MRKTEQSKILDSKIIELEIGSGVIYPLSVIQGYQTGDIYELENCTLIHHYCGFGFLCGEPTEGAFAQIVTLMKSIVNSGGRLVLFCDGQSLARRFELQGGMIIETREFYEFSGERSSFTLPEGFEIRELDGGIISRLDGRIVPSFSWESSERFLEKGKGFCVMHGQEPAAWAFSAAVSDDEIDIGVETCEQFRGKGLAAAAANEMIRCALSVGKKPVWACHSGNTGSKRVAQKLGFGLIGECFTVRI